MASEAVASGKRRGKLCLHERGSVDGSAEESGEVSRGVLVVSIREDPWLMVLCLYNDGEYCRS